MNGANDWYAGNRLETGFLLHPRRGALLTGIAATCWFRVRASLPFYALL